MELFQEALTTRIMLALPPDPPGFLGAVIDAFAEYLSLHPDFRTVAFGAPGGNRYVSRPTREAYAGSGNVSAMVREFLAEAYDLEMTAALELRLRLAIEIGDRLPSPRPSNNRMRRHARTSSPKPSASWRRRSSEPEKRKALHRIASILLLIRNVLHAGRKTSVRSLGPDPSRGS